MARSAGQNKTTGFQPGNKAAAGNAGPTKNRPITSAIIQKLNEVNKSTKREYIFDLVDELFNQAISHEETVTHGTGKNRKTTTIKVKGDLRAVEAIIERAEGKAVQAHSVEPGGGKMTFIFEPGDDKL